MGTYYIRVLRPISSAVGGKTTCKIQFVPTFRTENCQDRLRVPKPRTVRACTRCTTRLPPPAIRKTIIRNLKGSCTILFPVTHLSMSISYDYVHNNVVNVNEQRRMLQQTPVMQIRKRNRYAINKIWYETAYAHTYCVRNYQISKTFSYHRQFMGAYVPSSNTY